MDGIPGVRVNVETRDRSVVYTDRPRLFCPHRLGRNRLGRQRRLRHHMAEKARAV